MRTSLVTLVLMLFATTFLVATAQTDNTLEQKLIQTKKAVQSAALAGDADALKAAREQAQNLIQNNTFTANRKALALYYVGYANYSLSVLPSEKAASEQNTDAGVTAMEEAIKLEPTSADAHALLASLYGRKAAGGMMAGMKYGQKSSSSMERAAVLAPNNPRVLILQGISLYFKPAMFGGDKQKALTNLQKACEFAETGACANTNVALPDWGHAEAFAWKGVMFTDSEDTDNAKAAYERALQIAPNYAWVKFVLLPKVTANAR